MDQEISDKMENLTVDPPSPHAPDASSSGDVRGPEGIRKRPATQRTVVDLLREGETASAGAQEPPPKRVSPSPSPPREPSGEAAPAAHHVGPEAGPPSVAAPHDVGDVPMSDGAATPLAPPPSGGAGFPPARASRQAASGRHPLDARPKAAMPDPRGECPPTQGRVVNTEEVVAGLGRRLNLVEDSVQVALLQLDTSVIITLPRDGGKGGKGPGHCLHSGTKWVAF